MTKLIIACNVLLASIAAHAFAAYNFSVLANFSGANGIGAEPEQGPVMDAQGNLYGTTNLGGTGGYGTVFKVSATNHQLTTIANFPGGAGSAVNSGLIIDSAGTLFGTTAQAASDGVNMVYSVDTSSNALTQLATFSPGQGGELYSGVIEDSSGNLYGATENGGANSSGTLFRVNAADHSVTTLATLTATNGKTILGTLYRDAAGNLFGSTYTGGTGSGGAAFEYNAGTNSVGTLVNFNFTNGGSPEAGFIADSAGDLFGTTQTGGSGNAGTIFEIVAGTHAFKTVISLGGVGQYPGSNLIQDSSGNLFGVTNQGGTYNDGTVFEYNVSTGKLSTLFVFNGANGSEPVGLTFDSVGNIYGTTDRGGTFGTAYGGYGNVFELATTVVPEPANACLLSVAFLAFRCRKSRQNKAL